MNKSFVNSHKAYNLCKQCYFYLKMLWKWNKQIFQSVLTEGKKIKPASYRSTIIHLMKPQMFQFGFCVLLASGKMTNNWRYDSLETNNQMGENIVVFLNCYCCTIGETELIGRLINAYYIIKGYSIFRIPTMKWKSLFYMIVIISTLFQTSNLNMEGC